MNDGGMNDYQDPKEDTLRQSFEKKSDAQISNAIYTLSKMSAPYRIGKEILAERKRARDRKKFILIVTLTVIGLFLAGIGIYWNIYAG